MFAAVAIVMMVNFGLGTTCLSLFLSSWAKSFAGNMTVVATYYVVMQVGAIVTSLIMPRFLAAHAKLIYTLFGAVSGLGFILVATVPSLPSMYIAAAAYGFFVQPITVMGVPVILSKWFYKGQGTAISVAAAFAGVGGMLFSPVFSSLIVSIGWQQAMLVMGIVISVVCCIAGLFVSGNPLKQGILPFGATQEDIESMQEKSEDKSQADKISLPGISFADIWKYPGTYVIGMSFFIFGLCTSSQTMNATIIASAGFDAAVIGFTVSAASLGALIGKPLIGIVKDKVSARVASVAFVLMFAFGLVIYLLGFGVVHNAVLVYLGAFLFGAGSVVHTMVPPLLSMETYGPYEYDRIYGTINIFDLVGATIANVVFAAVFAASGGTSYVVPVLMLVVLLVVASILTPVGYRMVSDKAADNGVKVTVEA